MSAHPVAISGLNAHHRSALIEIFHPFMLAVTSGIALDQESCRLHLAALLPNLLLTVTYLQALVIVSKAQG